MVAYGSRSIDLFHVQISRRSFLTLINGHVNIIRVRPPIDYIAYIPTNHTIRTFILRMYHRIESKFSTCRLGQFLCLNYPTSEG